MKRRLASLALLIPCLVLVTSCGTDDGGPNLPPDTFIVTGPPEGSNQSYRVDLSWRGTDPDGVVRSFEFAWHSGRISDNGLDTLLDWVQTSKMESTFVVLADSCCIAESTYHGHTFFVRSIDNEGARDPSPAERSFTATTVKPTTDIVYPPRAAGQGSVVLPPCVTIRWQGTDDDGQVVAYRHAWKRYEDPPWHEPPDQDDPSRWSPWSKAREETIPLFQLDPDNPWTIYVQSMDNAGAVETRFTVGRNALLVYIDETKVNLPYISICCREGMCTGELGGVIACRSTADTTKWDTPVVLAVGDTICFESTFAPGQYAREVQRIKYLFNNPGPPGSWDNADVESNRFYPQGDGVFIVPPDINTIYFWVRDDYCTFGSTRVAYMRIQGTP